MTDREQTLQHLLSDIRAHEAVADAFLAKSFTDRVLILDTRGSDGVPEDIVTRLEKCGFYSAQAVYDESDGQPSSLGAVGDGIRHHFVDTETRGSHQSYVLD